MLRERCQFYGHKVNFVSCYPIWIPLASSNIIVSTKIQLDVKSGQVGFWAEIKVTSVQDFGHGT